MRYLRFWTRGPAPGLGFACVIAVGAIVAGAAFSTRANADGEPRVIELTQTPCQFVEIEGVDLGYTSTRKADCEAINAVSGADRLATSKVLELTPGTYVFRITNKNVPYELGFWIREVGYDWRNPLHKLTKTSVAGGGLLMGQTQDYEVTLEEGGYVFSCPFNPTLDYRLTVAGS